MIKEDYDLKKAWDEACDAFQKTASEDLKTKTKYTPDEVLEQIRAKQDKDEEKSAKYRVAKDVLSKTLDCLDGLANIAAQGASQVFAPAQLVGNALSFLIATGQKYKYIFEGLTELFSRISDFLVRFKVYFRMPDVDISLRKVLNELLICFVSICGMSIKYLKINKFLLYLQVFAFSDDSGVKMKLDELAALVEKEVGLGGVLTLEAVKNVQSGVATIRTELAEAHAEYKEGSRALNSTITELAESDKKREASTTMAKQLKAIETALGSPSNSYKTIQENLLSKKVDGTGDWIKQDPLFTEWVIRKPGTTKILSLSGGEGYGKSFLVSNIISDLRTRLPLDGEESVTRSAVAYYFFQREAKTSDSSKTDALSLITALKSLAWQITNSDPVYRKELHSIYASIEQTDRASLWTKLFGNSFKSDTTFYLILDGMDNLEATHVQNFAEMLQQAIQGPQESKERGPLCLRILISGRKEFIDELAKDHPISIIDVATKNQDDIKKFVLDGISRIKILGGSSEEDQQRRDGILTALTENSKGDFFSVNLLLKQISEKRRPAEMLEVLATFQGENRFDTIARTIEELDKRLDRHDIVDLNELLAWVLSSYRPMTLQELETILLMTNGQSGSSLQPLAESINERYSKLFTIVPEFGTKTISQTSTVKIVSTSIEDYFRQTREEQENNPLRSAKAGSVHESEVRIVKHFLRTVCDPELFHKFQFDQYFLKMSMTTAVIEFETEASHLEILSDCLEALCSSEAKWDTLHTYAIDYFPQHLSTIDLSLTDPKLKTSIGGNLVKLFTDEKTIAKWWPWHQVATQRYSWLISESYVEFVINWFKDSAVVKGLGAEDMQWTKELTSNIAPETDLLEHIAKYLANMWLKESSWDIASLVLFLYGYLAKIEVRMDPSKDDKWMEVDDMKNVPLKAIEHMLAWSKEKLSITELDYEMSRNIARTYRDCGFLEKSIELFKALALMQEDNWLARWGLATSYGAQKEWALQAAELEEVIKATEVGKGSVEYEAKAEAWDLPELHRELAQAFWNAGNFEKGMELYENIIRGRPEDYDTPYEYLSNLSESKNYDRLLHFINEMKGTHDEKAGLDRWTQIFCVYAIYLTFHMNITKAAVERGNHEAIEQAYSSAVAAAKEKQKEAELAANPELLEAAMDTYFPLVHFHAYFQFYARLTPDSTQLAVTAWEELLVVELDAATRRTYLQWTLSLVQKHLPFAYHRLAKESGYDSAIAKECIAKLQTMMAMPQEDLYQYPYAPNVALARIHSASGNTTEVKKALKTPVKMAMELLSDDDVDNDWQGYLTLGDTLKFAGEIDNFVAALSLITPFEVDGELPDEDNLPIETATTPENAESGSLETTAEVDRVTAIKVEVQETPEAKIISSSNNETAATIIVSSEETTNTPSVKIEVTNGNVVESNTDKRTIEPATPEPPKQPFVGPMGMSCDGTCGRSFTYSEDFHCCLDCTDVLFDTPCLEKLRAGTLDKLTCGKDHEMVQVRKYDPKKLKSIGKGNVEVGGKIMSVKEWLEGIRKDWGLETEKKIEKKVEEDGEKGVVVEEVVEVNVDAA